MPGKFNYQKMSQHLILTTGLYDLIKDHVRRKKVTPAEEVMLINQLKFAKQVRRRELPTDVVTVNSRVTIKDTATGEEHIHTFVPPGKAKMKHKTQSIMTPIGLALIGYSAGNRINWPINGEEREIEILKVEQL